WLFASATSRFVVVAPQPPACGELWHRDAAAVRGRVAAAADQPGSPSGRELYQERPRKQKRFQHGHTEWRSSSPAFACFGRSHPRILAGRERHRQGTWVELP